MKELLTRFKNQIIAAALLVPISILLCIYGFNKTEEQVFSYNEEGSGVEYSVCYREELNIGSGGRCVKEDVYIANLIDYVSSNFHYVASFSEPLSGQIDYSLRATLTAKRSGGDKDGNYGSREFELTKPKTRQFDKQQSIVVGESVNINYQDYSEIVEQFRREAAGASGLLKVDFVVKGNLAGESAAASKVPINATISMTIPIGERDTSISVATADGASPEKTHVQKVSIDNPIKFIARPAGVIALGYIVYVLASFIYQYEKEQRGSEYDENIKKVLSIYDSIIVAVKSAPNLEALNVIDVNEFDEILDVYNAVHMPINFYRSAKTARFIVISNDTAWRFTVRESDFAKKDDKKSDKNKKSDGEKPAATSAEGQRNTDQATDQDSQSELTAEPSAVAANTRKERHRFLKRLRRLLSQSRIVTSLRQRRAAKQAQAPQTPEPETPSAEPLIDTSTAVVRSTAIDIAEFNASDPQLNPRSGEPINPWHNS